MSKEDAKGRQRFVTFSFQAMASISGKSQLEVCGAAINTATFSFGGSVATRYRAIRRIREARICLIGRP